MCHLTSDTQQKEFIISYTPPGLGTFPFSRSCSVVWGLTGSGGLGAVRKEG